MDQHWIMVITELDHYKGLSQKSDMTIIFVLEKGDQAVLEKVCSRIDSPCLVDTEDGR